MHKPFFCSQRNIPWRCERVWAGPLLQQNGSQMFNCYFGPGDSLSIGRLNLPGLVTATTLRSNSICIQQNPVATLSVPPLGGGHEKLTTMACHGLPGDQTIWYFTVVGIFWTTVAQGQTALNTAELPYFAFATICHVSTIHGSYPFEYFLHQNV